MQDENARLKKELAEIQQSKSNLNIPMQIMTCTVPSESRNQPSTPSPNTPIPDTNTTINGEDDALIHNRNGSSPINKEDADEPALDPPKAKPKPPQKVEKDPFWSVHVCISDIV